MCLYPRFIKNKRYEGYKIKKGDTPCEDWRKKYVPIGCGKCYECKRQKAQQWRVRMIEELKSNKYAYFITLTFSNESLTNLIQHYNVSECNGIAIQAVRLFLERWRKKYKKSVKHWLITELGHENTERIHLHGILFPTFPINNNLLQSLWQYGNTDIGEYCNEQTINYIVKYVTKVDFDHKQYEPDICCSAGIGKAFLEKERTQLTYKYRPRKTPEYYTLNNGRKVALPIYYRNKLFTQNERDKMWTDRLDKQQIYVNGIRVDLRKGTEEYTKLLRDQQIWNEKLGYGSTAEEWKEKPYNITLKMLNRRTKNDASGL